MTVLERLRDFYSQQKSAMPQAMSSAPSKPYIMQRKSNDEAEMTLYGDIVETKPRDWMDEEVEGNYIVMSEVLKDIKALKDVKSLTIHIHSFGGSSAASTVIYNKLRDLDAHITCVVDGVAMSGGSVILCAADTVKVHSSSIVMIHNCWTCLFGGYNITDLGPVIANMEATNRSMMNIYAEKTGLDRERIKEMLDAETYMVGQEIVDNGFADELVEENTGTAEIAASADRHALFVSGIPVWIANGKLPEKLDNLPVVANASGKEANVKPVFAVPSANGGQEPNKIIQPNEGEGGNEVMAKTVDELRQEYPDLCKQLVDETNAKNTADIKAERKRIEEIDEIAPKIMDTKMVHDAKYGEKPMSAQELALEALKSQGTQGAAFLSAQQDDAEQSGADGVESTNVPPKEEGQETPEDMEAQAKADVAKFMNGKGE